MAPIKIIFFGSADFSGLILMKLIEKFQVTAVVTENDKPAGRNKRMIKPLAKIIAEKYGIICWQPTNLLQPDFLNQVKLLGADLIVVAGYGKILPEKLIYLPKQGSLNAHPSLLPKYRGASPIQSVLLNGEENTGSTIILMNNSIDGGDILTKERLKIDANDNYVTLEKKLARQCAKLLIKVIPNYIDSKIKLKAQNNGEATYCRKITKKDGQIDWNKPARNIANQIKAFVKWPGSYTYFRNKKLEIILAAAIKIEKYNLLKIGEVAKVENKIVVKCGQDFLEVYKIKLEGKNEVAVNDFLNGYRDFIGAILV